MRARRSTIGNGARWLGVALLVLVALLSFLRVSMTQVPPPPPPAFDLDAVKAGLTAECQNPVIVDAELCDQVKIPEMLGEETILTVLTTLDPAPNERLDAICEQLAQARFAAYSTVVVVGQKGGNRGCFVDGPVVSPR